MDRSQNYVLNPFVHKNYARVVNGCTEYNYHVYERYRSDGDEPDDRVAMVSGANGASEMDMLVVKNKRPKEKQDLAYFDKVANGQMKRYMKKSKNAAGTERHGAVVVGLHIKFYWMMLPVNNEGPTRDTAKPLHLLEDATDVQAWFQSIKGLAATQALAATPTTYAIRSAISGPTSGAQAYTTLESDSPPLQSEPDAVKVSVKYDKRRETYSWDYDRKLYTKKADDLMLGIAVEGTASYVCGTYKGRSTGKTFWFRSLVQGHNAVQVVDLQYEDHGDDTTTYHFEHGGYKCVAPQQGWQEALCIEDGYTYTCHHFSVDGIRLFWAYSLDTWNMEQWNDNGSKGKGKAD